MEQKSNGALISSIVIIVILIIGAIYFWKSGPKSNTAQPAAPAGYGAPAANPGPADVSDLETSANSVDVNNLDQGL